MLNSPRRRGRKALADLTSRFAAIDNLIGVASEALADSEGAEDFLAKVATPEEAGAYLMLRARARQEIEELRERRAELARVAVEEHGAVDGFALGLTLGRLGF